MWNHLQSQRNCSFRLKPCSLTWKLQTPLINVSGHQSFAWCKTSHFRHKKAKVLCFFFVVLAFKSVSFSLFFVALICHKRKKKSSFFQHRKSCTFLMIYSHPFSPEETFLQSFRAIFGTNWYKHGLICIIDNTEDRNCHVISDRFHDFCAQMKNVLKVKSWLFLPHWYLYMDDYMLICSLHLDTMLVKWRSETDETFLLVFTCL